jgi:hypothetical protein
LKFSRESQSTAQLGATASIDEVDYIIIDIFAMTNEVAIDIVIVGRRTHELSF